MLYSTLLTYIPYTYDIHSMLALLVAMSTDTYMILTVYYPTIYAI